MWGRDGALENWYTDQGGPVGIWKKCAKDVRGKSMAGGHFFPEAEPMATADELGAFFLGES